MNESTGQLPPVDADLWALVEALVDGVATAPERDRLQARLRTEHPARLFYVAYLDLHASLQWRTRGQSVPGTAGRPRRRLLGSLTRLAVAAAFVLTVTALVGQLVP